MEEYLDNKFYVPEISEFHPNFEFEEKAINGDWQKTTYPFGTVWFSLDDLVNGNIRVKHLDREDIESLGETNFVNNKIYFTNNVVAPLIITLNEATIVLPTRIKIEQAISNTTVFTGIVKNKSEFKRILKQIGV
jgi:hypothetical protein